jgi:hypothetical protein
MPRNCPKPVKTKADFVRRYAAGEFGNASPTWDCLEDWYKDNVGWNLSKTKFHIRNRIAGGMTWYDVPAYRMPLDWKAAIAVVEPDNLYISAMAPTELTCLQGEIERTHRQLALFYSRATLPMRDALRLDGRQVYGLAAAHLIQRYLDQNSQEWLWHLLDSYPGHVVEFSVYDKCWGTVPGYNSVFWEVRQY